MGKIRRVERDPVVGLLFVYKSELEVEIIVTMKKKKRAADDRKCHRSWVSYTWATRHSLFRLRDSAGLSWKQQQQQNSIISLSLLYAALLMSCLFRRSWEIIIWRKKNRREKNALKSWAVLESQVKDLSMPCKITDTPTSHTHIHSSLIGPSSAYRRQRRRPAASHVRVLPPQEKKKLWSASSSSYRPRLSLWLCLSLFSFLYSFPQLRLSSAALRCAHTTLCVCVRFVRLCLQVPVA